MENIEVVKSSTEESTKVKEEQKLAIKADKRQPHINFKETENIEIEKINDLIPSISVSKAEEILTVLINDGKLKEDLKNLDGLSDVEKIVLASSFILETNEYDLDGRTKVINGLKINEKRVGPVFNNVKVKEEMKGEQALLLLSSATGTGRPITNFLPTTGMYLKLKPLNSDDAITFEQIVAEAELEKLSDYTSSLLSSTSYYIVKGLVALLKRLKIDTNIKQSKLSLEDNILVDDIGFVFATLFASKYPKGYEGPVYCKNVFEKEEVTKEDGSITLEDKCDVKGLLTVDPLSMCYTDYEKFTGENFAIMGKSKIDLSEMVKYQNALNLEFERDVVIKTPGNDLTFTLFKATISEYLKYTEYFKDLFITRLEKIYDIYGEENDLQLRQKVEETNKLFDLLGYSYYIKKIVVDTPDGKVTITDTKTICQYILNSIEEPQLLVNIRKAIDDFKVENNIAFFGTPSFVCPKCKERNESDLEGINVLNAMGFFMRSLIG